MSLLKALNNKNLMSENKELFISKALGCHVATAPRKDSSQV